MLLVVVKATAFQQSIFLYVFTYIHIYICMQQYKVFVNGMHFEGHAVKSDNVSSAVALAGIA